MARLTPPGPAGICGGASHGPQEGSIGHSTIGGAADRLGVFLDRPEDASVARGGGGLDVQASKVRSAVPRRDRHRQSDSDAIQFSEPGSRPIRLGALEPGGDADFRRHQVQLSGLHRRLPVQHCLWQSDIRHELPELQRVLPLRHLLTARAGPVAPPARPSQRVEKNENCLLLLRRQEAELLCDVVRFPSVTQDGIRQRQGVAVVHQP